jgi:hypothetical protein
MNMDDLIEKVIERIVHIPYDFHQIKTKSTYTLLLESGYFEVYDQIDENKIIEALKKQPHLIAQWLQWSEDNRSSPSWYFTKGDDGKCFVGHWPEGKEFKEINTSDEFIACAAFIKRDIEQTRIVFTNKQDKSKT